MADSPTLAELNALFLQQFLKPGPEAPASAVSRAAFEPHVSIYDKILIFAPPPRQINAVLGLSLNGNDAQYVQNQGATGTNIITDADVYDCEAGALTVGMSYNGGTPAANAAKGLAFPWQLCTWDLDKGESLLLQMDVKTVDATGNQILFGNSNSAASEGFSVAQNIAGTFSFNYKAKDSALQSLTLTKPTFDGTSVVNMAVPTNQYAKLQILVHGLTKRINAWIDGVPCAINESPGQVGTNYSNAGTVLNPGSSMPATPRNMGMGHIPADTSFLPNTVRPARFRALRMAVLPAGLYFNSPGFLDWRFNRRLDTLFKTVDYLEGTA